MKRLKVWWKRLVTPKLKNPEMNWLVDAPHINCKHCSDKGEMCGIMLISFVTDKAICRCQRCQRIVVSFPMTMKKVKYFDNLEVQ